MNCRRIEPLLVEYADGSLGIEQRRAVDGHLLECNGCATAVSELALARDFLRRAPAPEPPPQLIAGILRETTGVAGAAPGLSPAGGPAASLAGFLRPILHPFLHPRVVMSMAMSLVSVTMLTYHGRGMLRQMERQQASPAAVWQSVQESAVELWSVAAEGYQSWRLFDERQTGAGASGEQGPPAAEKPPKLQENSPRGEPARGR